MRRIAIFMAVLIIPTALSAQDLLDKLIQKYQNQDDFVVVNITGNLFKLMASVEHEDPEAAYWSENLNSIRILAYEGNLKENRPNFHEIVQQELNLGEYKELMTVRENDERVNFWVKEKTGKISELLLVASGEDENAIISILGDIDMAKVASINSSLHINQLEHLEDIED